MDPTLRARLSSLGYHNEQTHCQGTSQHSLSDVTLTVLTALEKVPHKATSACDTCRKKKVKCNEGRPACSYCAKHKFPCGYKEDSEPRLDRLVVALLVRLLDAEERLDAGGRGREGSDGSGLVSGSQSGDGEVANRNGASPADTTSTLSINPRSQVSDDMECQYSGGDAYGNGALSDFQGARLSPPDFTTLTQPPRPDELLPSFDDFLKCPSQLFLVVCQSTVDKLAEGTLAHGLQEDWPSCFTLLIIALGKAYKDGESEESGLAEYQRATRLLNGLPVEITLEYVQIRVLRALFLLKKGQLLNFWAALQSTCTLIHTLIQTDRATNFQRSKKDHGTILAIYWICYNLERDFIHEIDSSFTRGTFHVLQDSLPLPLPCPIPGQPTNRPPLGATMMFLLAEMSLRKISTRIQSASGLENCIQPASATSRAEVAPLVQEFRNQLDGWLQSVPASLGWSPEPGSGSSVPPAKRLKLVYWYARFILFKPLILHAVRDPAGRAEMLTWMLFQEGMLAGVNTVKALLRDEPDLDILMSNRILIVVSTLKEAMQAGYSSLALEGNIDVMLKQAVDVVWRQNGYTTEWVKQKYKSLLPAYICVS